MNDDYLWDQSGPPDPETVRLEETLAPFRYRSRPLDLQRAPLSALAGGNASDNALILKEIFSGKPGPPRNVVLLNAAAVLVVGGLASNLRDGIQLAATTIDRGAVTQLVNALQQP